jgi:hypothetical protein
MPDVNKKNVACNILDVNVIYQCKSLKLKTAKNSGLFKNASNIFLVYLCLANLRLNISGSAVRVCKPCEQSKNMGEEVKILFFSAVPEDWDQLDADKEFRRIFEKCETRRVGIISISSMQTINLHNALLRNKPEIVHFSGHGIADEILFEDARRNGQGVSKDAFINLFGRLPKKPRLIFLNACFTAVNIEGLNQIVDFVIAAREEISDVAASVFAAKFYENLFLGTTVKAAFELAKNYFEIEKSEDEVEMYELFTREGAGEAVIFTQASSEAEKPPSNPNGGTNIQVGRDINTEGGDFIVGGSIHQYKYTK